MLWPYRLAIDSSRKGSGSCFVERALTGVSLAVIGTGVFEKRGKWRFLGSTGRRNCTLCCFVTVCSVPASSCPTVKRVFVHFMSVFYSCSNISFERNGPWWSICAWFELVCFHEIMMILGQVLNTENYIIISFFVILNFWTSMTPYCLQPPHLHPPHPPIPLIFHLPSNSQLNLVFTCAGVHCLVGKLFSTWIQVKCGS